MRQHPQKTKMTQTLTTIGHRTAFNNEQSPYRTVSYKKTIYNNVVLNYKQSIISDITDQFRKLFSEHVTNQACSINSFFGLNSHLKAK